MSRMFGKRRPSGEPKSDDSRDDSQPKRLRTESSNENNSDDALLNRLRRTGRLLGGLVRLGSEPVRCDLQLFLLINHSFTVRRHLLRHVELIGEGERSRLVIDLSDCPGALDVVRTVERFCLGLMDDNDISVWNVVKLIAVSTFLEMEHLTLRAFKFLEKRVFNSFHSFLDFLATFEDSDLSDVGEGTLFDKCVKVFLRKLEVLGIRPSSTTTCRMSCSTSVQRLLGMAKVLPPNIAKLIYQSCRMEKWGLVYDSTDRKTKLYGTIATYYPMEDQLKGASTVTLYLMHRREWVRWIEELSYALPDWSKRSALVSHLAKSMNLANDINVPHPKSYLSSLSWGFLSAVLVESVDLRALTELKTSPSDKLNYATDMDAEIANLEKLVGRGLGEGLQWTLTEHLSLERQQHDFVLLTLKKFEFGTLLSIVRQFRDLRSKKSHTVIIAKIFDDCLIQHLEAKTFTMRQAMLIYQEFPADSRSCHAEIYHVFEDFLRRKALCFQEVLDLMKLLDYQKLPDEIVEKQMGNPRLWERFMKKQRDRDFLRRKALCFQEVLDLMKLLDYQKLPDEIVEKLMGNPRLWERFMKKQRDRQRDRQIYQEKRKQEELMKLRNEHNQQTADLVKMRQELSARSADLTTATQDIRLVESILEDVIRSVLEEQEKTEELCKVTEEKRLAESTLNDLRRHKRLADSELSDVRRVLEEEQERTKEVSEEKRIAESQLKDVRRDLEEEQEKTTCQICFARPRDALSLPCMHFLYCFDCLHLHHKKSKTCPTCRGPTTGLLKCLLSI